MRNNCPPVFEFTILNYAPTTCFAKPTMLTNYSCLILFIIRRRCRTHVALWTFDQYVIPKIVKNKFEINKSV